MSVSLAEIRPRHSKEGVPDPKPHVPNVSVSGVNQAPVMPMA